MAVVLPVSALLQRSEEFGQIKTLMKHTCPEITYSPSGPYWITPHPGNGYVTPPFTGLWQGLAMPQNLFCMLRLQKLNLFTSISTGLDELDVKVWQGITFIWIKFINKSSLCNFPEIWPCVFLTILCMPLPGGIPECLPECQSSCCQWAPGWPTGSAPSVEATSQLDEGTVD